MRRAAREEGDGTPDDRVHHPAKVPHYVVSQGAEIDGNRSVPIEQLRPALVKLQAERRLRGVQPGGRGQCDRGAYQRLGYAQAKVNASANELNPPGPGQGLVRPVITDHRRAAHAHRRRGVRRRHEHSRGSNSGRSSHRCRARPTTSRAIVADRDAVHARVPQPRLRIGQRRRGAERCRRTSASPT